MNTTASTGQSGDELASQFQPGGKLQRSRNAKGDALKNRTDQTATGRTHPLAYVLVGGLVVGTIDIVFAMTFWAWWADVPAFRVLQTVAAGLLGTASFNGGPETAMLGLALHFAIALTIAVAFYIAARSWPVLWKHATEAGIAYGFFLYGIMNHVVVPLSAAPGGETDTVWVVFNVFVHVLFIGVPIALFVRQGLQQWRSEA